MSRHLQHWTFVYGRVHLRIHFLLLLILFVCLIGWYLGLDGTKHFSLVLAAEQIVGKLFARTTGIGM